MKTGEVDDQSPWRRINCYAILDIGAGGLAMLNKFADTIKEKPIIGWAVFGVVLALGFLLGLLAASVT